MKPAKTKLNFLGEKSPANSARNGATSSQTEEIGKLAFEVEVVSDVICPWCWVGKPRLEKAIALLGPAARVKLTWRPFQLNPPFSSSRKRQGKQFSASKRLSAPEQASLRQDKKATAEKLGGRFLGRPDIFIVSAAPSVVARASSARPQSYLGNDSPLELVGQLGGADGDLELVLPRSNRSSSHAATAGATLLRAASRGIAGRLIETYGGRREDQRFSVNSISAANQSFKALPSRRPLRSQSR